MYDAEVAPTMMYFKPAHMPVLDEAVMVAEELVSEHFSLSSRHWIKNPYDIRTLVQLNKREYPGRAYAHLVRYCRPLGEKLTGADSFAFYRVCLHDHNILKKTDRGRKDALLPFLIYVMTHELVHIVRFSLYSAHPSASAKKEVEEERVCRLTWDILEPSRIKGMDNILGQFVPA